MQALRALFYCCERATDGLRRHPGAASAVVVTMAVGLFLVGLVHVVFQIASAATGGERRAHLVLYLADGVTSERAGGIRESLAALPAVAAAELVTAADTRERLLTAVSPDDALLSGLEPALFPASIEVALRPGTHRVATLAPVLARLRANPAIDDVVIADDRVEQLTAVRAGLSSARSLALLFALLVCGYLTVSAVSARFGPRVREASVARLFGASTAFVRAPLVLEGLVQGALAAVLAVLGVALFSSSIGPGLGAVPGPHAAAALGLPGGWQLVGFIASGAGLGAACTWLATRRHGLA